MPLGRMQAASNLQIWQLESARFVKAGRETVVMGSRMPWTFTQEILLFIGLCVVLRISGLLLNFIAKRASAMHAHRTELLNLKPPPTDPNAVPQPAGA